MSHYRLSQVDRNEQAAQVGVLCGKGKLGKEGKATQVAGLHVAAATAQHTHCCGKLEMHGGRKTQLHTQYIQLLACLAT